MTDPLGPIDRAQRPRRVAQRRGAASPGRRAADQAADFPVPVVQPVESPAPPPPEGLVAFTAQVMGQGGQKRGLRGGRETLDHARTAYLETEWSGGANRRTGRGKLTKTEI